VAVAARPGKMPLYITKVLGCTSIHKPNLKIWNAIRSPDAFEIQNEIEIDVTT